MRCCCEACGLLTYCCDAEVGGIKAGLPPPNYKAPAYDAPDVERGMLTKQKQPIGEEPREFIRFR